MITRKWKKKKKKKELLLATEDSFYLSGVDRFDLQRAEKNMTGHHAEKKSVQQWRRRPAQPVNPTINRVIRLFNAKRKGEEDRDASAVL